MGLPGYRSVAPLLQALARSPLLRLGGLVLAGQLGVAIVGLLAVRLYTELAPARTFGEANLLLSAWTLGLQLLVTPFTSTQLRFHAEAESRGEARAFTIQSLTWAMRAAGVVAVLAACATAAWFRAVDSRQVLPLLAAALIWPLGTALRNVFMSRINAQRRQKAYVALLLIESLLAVGLTALALGIAPSSGAFLLGQAAAPCLLAAALAWSIREPGHGHAGANGSRTLFAARALSYGVPFGLMSLFSWLSNLSDRYVLAMLLGPAAAGLYVAPFAIASRALALPGTALTDLFRPLLFAAASRGNEAQAAHVFHRWLLGYAALSLLGIACLAVAGQALIPLLLAREYRVSAYPIMLWIAAAYAIYGLTQVVENRILSLGRSRPLLWSIVAGAVANIALSYALVSRHGIVGAAQANCLSFLAQGLVTVVLLRSQTAPPHASAAAVAQETT
jgi:O-antigen/teichoic acid export membrane protein